MNLQNELIEEIKTIHPKSFKQSITKRKGNIFINQIIERTKYLDIGCKFNERIYHIIHNMYEYKKCPICNNIIKNFLDFNRGYCDTCCFICARKHKNEEKSINISITRKKIFFEENIKKLEMFHLEVISDIDYLIKNNKYKVKCKDCNCIYDIYVEKQLFIRRCIKCGQKSLPEIEINEFIEELGFKTIRNSRKFIAPFELDLFIPEKNIAIEYDGLFWHSFGKDDIENKKCHLNKTILAEEKNINLFHIFENEWLNPIKQEIWKSIIKSNLGINQTIGARKCKIKELTSSESKEFLDNNHLQGSCNASVRLGLFYNNELVSVLTLAKPRFNKNYDWEIVRFANKINVNIIGSFSKLLKYFRQNYSGSIITYADKRYSKGNIYKFNGFEELKDSQPNYFYTKGQELHSRIQYQKHKLKDFLKEFNPELTEAENMFNNGFKRIWDCGNKVFVLK